MSYTVKTTRNLDDLPEARDIRTRVFIEEQGFVNEFDEIDRTALHLVLFDGDTAVATGRLFPAETPGAMHIGRVAVLPSHRGRRLGAAVLRELEAAARADGCKTVELSAQTRAAGFYETIGYRQFGEVYLDEYCPHICMKKTL